MSQSSGDVVESARAYERLKALSRVRPGMAAGLATQQEVDRLAQQGIHLPGRKVTTRDEAIMIAKQMMESDRLNNNL